MKAFAKTIIIALLFVFLITGMMGCITTPAVKDEKTDESNESVDFTCQIVYYDEIDGAFLRYPIINTNSALAKSQLLHSNSEILDFYFPPKAMDYRWYYEEKERMTQALEKYDQSFFDDYTVVIITQFMFINDPLYKPEDVSLENNTIIINFHPAPISLMWSVYRRFMFIIPKTAINKDTEVQLNIINTKEDITQADIKFG